jgi:pimeloyl-ACP methyl ester carboxylesterase
MFHSPQWLERIAARPGSAVQGFRTGHWVMVDQPEVFNQRVVAWLNEDSQAA